MMNVINRRSTRRTIESDARVLASDFLAAHDWPEGHLSLARGLLGMPEPRKRDRNPRDWRAGFEAVFVERELVAWIDHVRLFFPTFLRRTARGAPLMFVPTASALPLAEVAAILGWSAERLGQAQESFGFPRAHLRSPERWQRSVPYLYAHEVSTWIHQIELMIPDAFADAPARRADQ